MAPFVGVRSERLHLVTERDTPMPNYAGVRDADLVELMVAGAQQVADEIAHVCGRYPGSAEARVDLSGRQVLGLHGFERVHIALVSRIVGRSGFGRLQLGADVAREVLVLSL